MIFKILLLCLASTHLNAAPVPEYDDYHGLNFDSLSLLKSPLYTEPIIKTLPAPYYTEPIIKTPVISAPIYSQPILKTEPLLTHGPVYAPAPVYKAVAPVVKTVLPATSYATVTQYHVSHAPIIKTIVAAPPVLKTLSYGPSYGYH